MGPFSFFSKRRDRERAIPEAELDAQQSLGSFANSEGQPVVGQQPSGGAPAGFEAMGGLAALSQLGPMIQKAIETGNVQIEQGPTQTFDMRGSGLREEILQIMKQHGIDAEAGTAQASYDAADYGDMQKQILEALSKHGLNMGGAPGVQVDPPPAPEL